MLNQNIFLGLFKKGKYLHLIFILLVLGFIPSQVLDWFNQKVRLCFFPLFLLLVIVGF